MLNGETLYERSISYKVLSVWEEIGWEVANLFLYSGNIIWCAMSEDYVTIRRYLIEYGFMERTNDCKEYWINERDE